jgi:hypothetical protein
MMCGVTFQKRKVPEIEIALNTSDEILVTERSPRYYSSNQLWLVLSLPLTGCVWTNHYVVMSLHLNTGMEGGATHFAWIIYYLSCKDAARAGPTLFTGRAGPGPDWAMAEIFAFFLDWILRRTIPVVSESQRPRAEIANALSTISQQTKPV